MNAYLEDFRLVKLIINKKNYNKDCEFILEDDDKKLVLNINNIECFGEDLHIYLSSNEDIIPRYDNYLVHNQNKVLIYLGRITRSQLFDKYYNFNDWLGYKYKKDSTTFRLWSPVAKEIKLILNDEEYLMSYLSNGVYEAIINQDCDGYKYHYMFRINEKWEETIDPFGLSSNSNHRESYVINLENTYKMKNNYYHQENFDETKAIIYELNVRDATSKVDCNNRGTYLGLMESSDKDYGLGYIKKLGVTHIQLMPIYAFAGVNEEIIDGKKAEFLYNWGYNPMQYFVPSGFFTEKPNDPYARINELKQLVDEIHKLGLAVNMDVVYNHVYDSKWFPMEKLVPGYTFRTDNRGYLTNSSWCGNDLKTDHLMIRKLIIDSISHFQQFYKIDGFRFDLMGLIDIETINQIVNKLKNINRNAMFYGEGWNMDVALPYDQRANMNNYSKMPLVSFFNDYYRDFIKSILIGKSYSKNELFNSIKGLLFHGGTFLSSKQSINYLECHDNATLYDYIKLNTKNLSEEEILDRIRLGLSINVLSLGIPFIHAGEELLRTKQLHDNSYNLNDEINGINWYNEQNLTNTLIDLISIRKENNHFNYYKKEDIKKYVKLERDKNLLSIRLISFENHDLQMFIKFNREPVVKYFSPETKLIFDGTRKCEEEAELYTFTKSGVYLFKK